MKLVLSTLALAGISLLAVQNAEAAQQTVRPDETYCLETSVGGGGSGGTINLCNFRTMAQCIASKVAQGDHCDINPILAFQEWNRRHAR
jgi:hypothetical protein